VPEGISKTSAVRHLMVRVGTPGIRVIYAGDSGNDRHPLASGVFWGVLVGNAPEDLREDLRRTIRQRGFEERVYFASAPYAAGVLEGCRWFGLDKG